MKPRGQGNVHTPEQTLMSIILMSILVESDVANAVWPGPGQTHSETRLKLNKTLPRVQQPCSPACRDGQNVKTAVIVTAYAHQIG
jgi:hypothetical protein